MVGVLDEFARAGHQLLVFTEDRSAQRHFSTLHATLWDLETLRQAKPISSEDTAVSAEPIPAVQTTKTRIIRKTYDGHSTPVLRLATISVPDPGTSHHGTEEGDLQQDDVFYLTESSSCSDFPVLGADTCTLFSQIQIYVIGDLLAADAGEVARQLDRERITPETVQLWQVHMGLMCHVPNLTLEDAQILAANGIDSPEDWFDVDIDALLQSIEAFLRTESGRRFSHARDRYRRSQLGRWRTGARRYRDRWQRASRRYSGWQTRRSHRSVG